MCGLKQEEDIQVLRVSEVTPCMGVWIETHKAQQASYEAMSHPVWVCGLKHDRIKIDNRADVVTPCMGVWIETTLSGIAGAVSPVTPCMGVWIETESSLMANMDQLRHTLYGCVD